MPPRRAPRRCARTRPPPDSGSRPGCPVRPSPRRSRTASSWAARRGRRWTRARTRSSPRRTRPSGGRRRRPGRAGDQAWRSSAGAARSSTSDVDQPDRRRPVVGDRGRAHLDVAGRVDRVRHRPDQLETAGGPASITQAARRRSGCIEPWLDERQARPWRSTAAPRSGIGAPASELRSSSSTRPGEPAGKRPGAVVDLAAAPVKRGRGSPRGRLHAPAAPDFPVARTGNGGSAPRGNAA